MLVTMDDLDTMNKPGQVTRLDPIAAIPGGEVAVEYEITPSEVTREIGIQFDGSHAHITADGRTRALVVVPEMNTDAPVNVATVLDGSEVIPSEQRLVIGKKLAGGL